LPFEDISALPPLERYHRTLRYIDAQIEELLRRLAPVMDDTIVIVAADHGEGFGLHHDNQCHNGQVFEDDLRIPLVIAPPRWQGAVRTARIGSNVDFAPTLTALLGLPAMPTWTGQDLLSRTYQPPPQAFFSRSAFFTNGILDGDQKFFYYADSGEERFYDLATDPQEQHNIAKVRGTQIARYRALLDRWLPVIESHAASKAASMFPQRVPNLSVALRSH
jgi:arylsulfatase A-like enzyme